MSDQIDDKPVESDDSGRGVLATVSDVVTDAITGATIPAPVRRNALKAFGQLCTAAIDIPVSYLEGKAAEKRAETQGRIKIISTGADQIAVQMNVDPEYARVAEKKFVQQIVREQVNADKACEVAARQILQESTSSYTKQKKSSVTDSESEEIEEINDDWLNQYEKEVRLKSTEEMQLLFGRILAGEIQRPSSFSIKTVKLLGELDNSVATLFQHICSLCISLRANNTIYDARVVSLTGNAASNSLLNYGLNFNHLNLLHEHGLIISDYNSYFNYRMCVADKERQVVKFGFSYQNQDWAFTPTVDRPKEQELNLHGVLLSQAGKELLSIVDLEHDEEYTSALQKYFGTLNLQMVKITKY